MRDHRDVFDAKLQRGATSSRTWTRFNGVPRVALLGFWSATGGRGWSPTTCRAGVGDLPGRFHSLKPIALIPFLSLPVLCDRAAPCPHWRARLPACPHGNPRLLPG